MTSIASSTFATVTEADLTKGEQLLNLQSRLRNLQLDGVKYDRSDLALMASLAPRDGPTRITVCTENGLVAGFQVWYGLFDVKAGPAHGNILTSSCEEKPLYNKVVRINVWRWAEEQYAGLQIVMVDYADGSAAWKTIDVGQQDGAAKQTWDFSNSGKDTFFGFATKEDGLNRLTEIAIITYNK